MASISPSRPRTSASTQSASAGVMRHAYAPWSPADDSRSSLPLAMIRSCASSGQLAQVTVKSAGVETVPPLMAHAPSAIRPWKVSCGPSLR